MAKLTKNQVLLHEFGELPLFLHFKKKLSTFVQSLHLYKVKIKKIIRMKKTADC